MRGFKKGIFLLLLCVTGFISAQNHTINLAGDWQFALDSLNKGEAEKWFNKALPLQIKLPGTTDEAGYGKELVPGAQLYNDKPEIWRLARKHRYIGKAWYQRTIEIPENWDKKNISLFLERAMWQTKVWVNGNYIGENHSLCAPHQFNLSEFLKPGKNTLSICIDNSAYVYLGTWSHGYSPGMQTIWNGAVGEVKLIVKDKIHIENVQVYPSLKNQTLKIKGKLISLGNKKIKGKLNFSILDKNNTIVISSKKKVVVNKETNEFETTIRLKNKLLTWDEFEPNLYQLEIKSAFKDNVDREKITFGLRDIEAKNGSFYVNGNKVFMRGEHDGGSAPLTGYAPMDKKEWLRIFTIGKKHGLNHWRFHSWSPGKAAFEAADELGIYLQPELSLFPQRVENTLMGVDDARDGFLFEELQELLDNFGNHPSFVLMSMGNELKGDHKILEKWVAWGKEHDNRHLYAGNSNLGAMRIFRRLEGDDFQVSHTAKYSAKEKRIYRRMAIYFNNEAPNTVNDYSHAMLAPYKEWPIISHEVGQWLVYPDLSEIEKYKGVLAPRNMEVFKSRLAQKGMLEQAPDFVAASGKLAALLYREEMERLLRTPDIDGYQLLDLRDYPAQGSALVGLLNAFWESKGVITEDEFRQSNNDVTLLLKMEKRTWVNNETFNAGLVIPNYGNKELSNLKVNWNVSTESGKEISSGSLQKSQVTQGEIVPIGDVSFDLSTIKKASKLIVHLSIPEMNIENNYDIWVYPAVLPKQQKDKVIIATEATPSLLQKIKDGATVLLIPKEEYDAEKMRFTTPFWSTILFSYQEKSMGVLCEPKHPVFKDFPTDFHTNWQWWDLTHSAYAVRLNQTNKGYKPLIQVIDHAVRNDKLGALVETKIGKGKLMVSTLDILSDIENRPVARQLKHSILSYMNSDDFNPKEEKGIKEAFFNNGNKSRVVYAHVESSNESSNSPAVFAFDNDESSFWEPINNNAKSTVIITLDKPRYIKGCTFNVGEKNKPGNFKVYISSRKNKKEEPIIIGNLNHQNTFEAESWDNGFTVQKGKKGKYIFIEIDAKTDKEKFRVNEIKWIFGD